nr:alanine racemase [bacterium]
MERLIIQRDAVRANIARVRQLAGNARVIGVIKGNGYGAGLIPMSRALRAQGIDFLAVDAVCDAAALRADGFSGRILLLHPIDGEDTARRALLAGAEAMIGSYPALETYRAAAEALGMEAPAHLYLDTGFGGFGFDARQMGPVIEAARQAAPVRFVGTGMHFAQSFAGADAARQQYGLFMQAIGQMEKAGMDPGLRHCCNSHAMLNFPDMHLDAVRIGSAFMGRVGHGFLPVGYLEGEVLGVHPAKKGDFIGYGRTARMKQDGQLCVIGIGYAEGVGMAKRADAFRLRDRLRAVKAAFCDRPLSVSIAGRRCPVVGRVNMHHFTVRCDGARPGQLWRMPCQPLFISQRIPRVWVETSNQ